MLRVQALALVVCSIVSAGLRGDEPTSAETPVFSGPQVGESLPSLTIQGVLGEHDGKTIDLVAEADGGPLLIVFFHELTRPGFALTRAVTNYAATRKTQGMTTSVVFLGDDATERIKWAGQNRHLFSDQVIYGVSPDGGEGPGAYGLNRNVTLTIVVANEGKVTANFALVQPQLQADGPGILKAIVAVSGGGEVPSVDELEPRYARGENMRGNVNRPNMDATGERAEADPKLSTMLRAVINKQAGSEQVRKAAASIEAYVAENESARRELARIVTTVVNSGKIENYGTATAQEILRQWLSKYGEPKPATGDADQDDADQDDEKKDEA